MPAFLDKIKARKFASASSLAVEVGVTAESEARLKVDAGGKLTFGDGSSLPMKASFEFTLATDIVYGKGKTVSSVVASLPPIIFFIDDVLHVVGLLYI